MRCSARGFHDLGNHSQVAMQRTVVITLTIPDDHSDSAEEVTMVTKFSPSLIPNEKCLSAAIVNSLIEAFEGKEVKIV